MSVVALVRLVKRRLVMYTTLPSASDQSRQLALYQKKASFLVLRS